MDANERRGRRVILPYREGSWFAVTLLQGGFAKGLVARATSKGGVVPCCFFGPRRPTVPSLTEIAEMRPEQSPMVLRVGDRSLVRGERPITGDSVPWERARWPMPTFVQCEELTDVWWRTYCSNDDPNRLLRRVRIDADDVQAGEPRDGQYGAGAAEVVLDHTLLRTPAPAACVAPSVPRAVWWRR